MIIRAFEYFFQRKYEYYPGGVCRCGQMETEVGEDRMSSVNNGDFARLVVAWLNQKNEISSCAVMDPRNSGCSLKSL